MIEILEQLSAPWAIRAFITSSMVGITCGILGPFIVLRNMSLIGDALAHAILPGIFISFILFGYNVFGFFIGSVLAGLATSFGITWIQQYAHTKNDAAIGIVFSAMFAIGVMGISKISQRGVHLDLTDFLFGEVLGISNTDIYMTFGVMIFVILSVSLFYRYLFITTFQQTIAKTMGINVKFVHYFLMFLLSFAVVSALSSVGVILVVAMLITPASTALLLSNRLKHVIFISAFIGLICANMGLLIAIWFNTNPGPAMTVTVTSVYLLVVFFSPKKGLLFKALRRRKSARLIIQEDILRRAIRQEKAGIESTELSVKLGLSKSKIQKSLEQLIKNQLVKKQGKSFVLSDAGKHKANQLVRAHRLWESYLVKSIGMSEDEIHEEADRLEHHLSKEILDEVDESLGFPDIDPHGSPIPKKQTIFLDQAALSRPYIIIKDQATKDIDSALWDMGILPNITIQIQRKTPRFVELLFQNKRIRVNNELAQKVKIR